MGFLCTCGHTHPGGQMFCDDPAGNCKCGGYCERPVEPPIGVEPIPEAPVPVASRPMGDVELQVRAALIQQFPQLENWIMYAYEGRVASLDWCTDNFKMVIEELNRRRDVRMGRRP